MNEFYYSPYLIESIDLEFNCDQCNTIIYAKNIEVPLFYFDNKQTVTSQIDSTKEVCCNSCNKKFYIDFFVSMENGRGRIRDANCSHVFVIENHEKVDYFDFSDYENIKPCNDHFTFLNHITSTKKLLSLNIEVESEFSFLVMSFPFVISAMEGYLASTLTYEALNSKDSMLKLIKTEKELSNCKMSLFDVIKGDRNPNDIVINYINHILFHNINKVSRIFSEVLGIKFGDVSWLYRAIQIRHDCVHRAGYDIQNNKININREKLIELINNCENLIDEIELERNINSL